MPDLPPIRADRIPRTAGFRLSPLDVVILVISTIVTVVAWRTVGDRALIVPFTVLHFFLFCNVFRIHRRKELEWAAVAVVNVTAWACVPDASTWWPVLLQLPLTAMQIAREMRGPWYHGIFAKRINPRLDDYLGFRLPGDALEQTRTTEPP